MDEIQFNLDMLDVQTGMRRVTAKAKSPGYDDSYESDPVMFADTMELSGTWIFKDTLKFPTNDTWRVIENIPFTSYLNSSGVHTKFKSMQFSRNVYIQETGGSVWCLWYASTGEETGTAVSSQMYVETKGWASGSYPKCKTVTFDGVVVVSREFYDVFVPNAVRQEITFTIGGTSYTALSGMTWGEWCESEYNTRACYIRDDGYVRDGTALRDLHRVLGNDDYERQKSNMSIISGAEYIPHGTHGGGSA